MIFFTSWESLGRIFVIGVLSYFALVLMLKLSGNRTLSQMNSFDFIITIAMGSTFSSGLLDKQIALLDTVAALFLLIGMQYVITKLCIHSKVVNSFVKNEPVILFHKGEFRSEAMKKVRIGKDELLAAMRTHGLSTFSQVEAIVLETNGKLSAIPKQVSAEEQLSGTKKSYHDVRNMDDKNDALSLRDPQ